MPRASTATKTTAAAKTAMGGGGGGTESTSLASLELKKAIHKITNVQEDFVRSVEQWTSLTSESIFNLDAEISSRKRQLDDMEEDMSSRKKRRMIDVDNDILKYKRDACVKFLQENNEVPISCKELDELRTARDRAEQEAEKRVSKEKEKSKRAVSEAVKHTTMQHKADVAELTATVNQQKREIQSLQTLSQTLKEEVEKQRRLTQSVAEASRAAPISQTIGGSK
jgi:chromosome segregation ATPase